MAQASPIAEQWYNRGATVVYKTYQPLTPAQQADGTTATIVTASHREWVPGRGCPDGFEFDDKSVVLATTGYPKVRDDMVEMRKDDKSTPKELYGTEAKANEWHAQVREDIDGAPDDKTYKNRKVYVVPSWDLESQLEDIKKGRVTKQIKRGK